MPSSFAHNATLDVIWDDLLNNQKRRYILEDGSFVQLTKPVVLKSTVSIMTPLEPYSFQSGLSYLSTPYHLIQSRLYTIFTGRTLPGSMKTKRLRKKRNKALSNWLTRR